MKKTNFLNTTTDSRSYHIIRTIPSDPYWGDIYCNSWYYAKGRKRKNKSKKELFHYEYRRYRTWKYNRKTQYKNL